MTQNVYKVVVIDEDTGKYKSVCSLWRKWGRDMDKIALEYKIGKVTKPKIENSKIFAFHDLKYAERFAETNCKDSTVYAILDCESGNQTIIMIVSYLYTQMVRAFWAMLDGRKTMSAPAGTIGCDWVKPIKVVKTKGM